MSATMASASNRLRRALVHPRFAWVLGLIAFLAHAPGLGAGYLIDDHVHRYFAHGGAVPGGPRGPWDLYRFADGGAGVRSAIDAGLHPWWTSPALKLAFFRPVTSLLRIAEEAVFGDYAIFCHLVSSLLFVATTLAVLALFRRWIGGAAASLGALLFAIDDAHATAVTWTAARHAVLGTLFVVLALHAYLRARDEGRSSIASGALFFLGLASSESALSGLAFFGALALFDDTRPWRQRIGSLAPASVAVLTWVGFYRALDQGARGSAFYVDPLASPRHFLELLTTRAPALMLAQLFAPPAEVASMSPSAAPAIAVFGAAFFAVFAWLSLRALPERAKVVSLLVAFVLALVPACGTNGEDRLLVLPGVAAFGLLALWARHAARPKPSLALRAAAGVGVLVHVIMALLLLPVRSHAMASMLARMVDRGSASVPPENTGHAEELVILSAPDSILPTSMFIQRSLQGKPARFGRLLTTSPATPATLTRLGDSVFEIHCEGGMMHDPFLGALRPGLFVAGERVEVPGVTYEVLAVRDAGYPTAIRFSFAGNALVDGSRRFLTWRDHAFAEVTLPPVGGSLELPALDLAKELASSP
jgi:hypothetical protein